jgi:hypothetical protein
LEEILQNFFCEGKYWLNMELLTPLMENIIPYGKSQLRIHNVQDEKGIVGRGMEPLLNLIKVAQEEINHTFDIDKTNKVSFSVIDPLKFFMELDNLKAGLTDENTLDDFLAIGIGGFIDYGFAVYNKDDIVLKSGLIRRWAYSDKSTNIIKLLAGIDPELTAWIRKNDSNIEDIKTEIMEPIINLFSKVGVRVLKNLNNISSSNPEEAKKIIICKAKTGINKMKEYRGEKLSKLDVQYKRFLRAGGIESIVPIEGIVFEFDDKLFKLTGSYLPLLKIISFFRFGRDNN